MAHHIAAEVWFTNVCHSVHVHVHLVVVPTWQSVPAHVHPVVCLHMPPMNAWHIYATPHAYPFCAPCTGTWMNCRRSPYTCVPKTFMQTCMYATPACHTYMPFMCYSRIRRRLQIFLANVTDTISGPRQCSNMGARSGALFSAHGLRQAERACPCGRPPCCGTPAHPPS